MISDKNLILRNQNQLCFENILTWCTDASPYCGQAREKFSAIRALDLVMGFRAFQIFYLCAK